MPALEACYPAPSRLHQLEAPLSPGPNDPPEDRQDAALLADATQGLIEQLRADELTIGQAMEIASQDRLLRRSFWVLFRVWVARKLFPMTFEPVQRHPTERGIPLTARDAIEQQVVALDRTSVVVLQRREALLKFVAVWSAEIDEDRKTRENESTLLAQLAAKVKQNALLSLFLTAALAALLGAIASRLGYPLPTGASLPGATP